MMSKAEKFIQENIKALKESNGKEYFMWLTPDQARKAVEIARDEIYEWLWDNLPHYFNGTIESYGAFIHKLMQAIKDE